MFPTLTQSQVDVLAWSPNGLYMVTAGFDLHVRTGLAFVGLHGCQGLVCLGGLMHLFCESQVCTGRELCVYQ